MKHFILFKEIENLSLAQLIELIDKRDKIIIANIKFIDLIYEKHSMTGVYIFFNEDNIPVYVGKTGSRAILERMAGHFDLRAGVYMNSFLCALAGKPKRRLGPFASHEDIRGIYDKALKHKFIFIEIPNWGETRKLIQKLEGILSNIYKTELNSRRKEREINLDTLISTLFLQVS